MSRALKQLVTIDRTRVGEGQNVQKYILDMYKIVKYLSLLLQQQARKPLSSDSAV